MTLREYLKSTHHNLKIGTALSSGFIYCGRPEGFDETKEIRRAIKNYKDTLSRYRAKHNRPDRVAELERTIATFPPFSSREVLRTYPAGAPWEPPGTVIVIIEGGGSGSYWWTGESKK